MKFERYPSIENRVLSIFSKHGPIQEMKQLGDYIKWIIQDAQEDFMKDNSNIELTDKELKQVFKVGADVVKLLKVNL